MKFSGNTPFNQDQKKEYWDQKQVILNKFRSQQRDILTERTNEEDHQEDYKHLYRKAKRDLDKLQKKYEKLKQSELDQSVSEKQHMREFDTLKNNHYRLRHEHQKIVKKNRTLHQELENAYEEIDAFKKMISNNEDELKTLGHAVHKLKNKLDKRKTLVDRQSKKIKKLKRENIEVYKSEIHALKDKNHHLKLQLEQARLAKEKAAAMANAFEQFSPAVILEMLHENMDLTNYHSYGLAHTLNRKFMSYKKLDRDNRVKRGTADASLFGYVNEKDHTFIDLNNHEYRVRFTPQIRINGGDPVAARLNPDHSVDIIWKYNTKEMMKMDLKLSHTGRKSNSSSARERNYAFLGDYSVLVVTSNDGKKYKNRLFKHGLNANWIDPYEKSPVHVRNEMQKNDIVIICTDSVPHNVIENIEENPDSCKYQLLHNHNEDIVYNRVRIAVKQMMHEA